MASIFIGLNRGAADSPGSVTEGASTGGTDVELRIDTGKSLTRLEVTIITNRLLEYLNDGSTAVFPL